MFVKTIKQKKNKKKQKKKTLSLYPVVSPFPPERNPSKSLKKPLLRQRTAIGLLHDDVILLPRPESFRIFFFCKLGFFYINLAGITEFKRGKEKRKGFWS